MTRTVVVEVGRKHCGLWPRVMNVFVSRFNGARLPSKGERVVIEAADGEVLKVDAIVEKINGQAREYVVRIW